jgi:hypothetical protein
MVATIVAEIAAVFFWIEAKVSEALACGAMIRLFVK